MQISYIYLLYYILKVMFFKSVEDSNDKANNTYSNCDSINNVRC